MSQLQVTGEAKIRDIQGPVVANSGVITALDGAASQYVRGDGTLADFPTSSGGGSSVSYYLNSSVSQGTIGGVAYRELSKEPIIGAGTDIAISSNGYVASYLTDANDPDVILIPGGNFNCEFYFSVNNNTGNPFFYAELYKYDGTTFTLLGSSVGVPEYITQGTTIAPYYFAIPVATATLALTDRLAIRIYVNVGGRTVTLHTENGHLCQVVTTLSKGMVSLNNLTDQSQFLAVGTSGTDFNIVSSGDTHTFNIPSASASNRGLITTGSQTIAGIKTLSVPSQFEQGLYLKQNMNLFQAGYIGLGASTTGLIVGLSGGGFGTLNFNNTTSFTYTFPDATGTIALTSDLSSYVPYTGATEDVFLGANSISGAISTFQQGVFNGNGTNPANIYLKKGSSPFFTNANNYGLIAAVSSSFILVSDVDGANYKYASFNLGSLTNNTNRAYTLPDLSGTLALLEGSQTFSGSKIFSNSAKFTSLVFVDRQINISKTPSLVAYTGGYITNYGTTSGIIYADGDTSNLSTLNFNFGGNYTYTFPAASGTLALTSNLSSYVPYTGATTNVDLGARNLSSYAVNVNGDGTSGGALNLKMYNSLTLAGVGYLSIYAQTDYYFALAWNFVSGTKQAIFNNVLIPINNTRYYNLPNADGTLALTSDLSAYLPLAGGTLTGALNGTTATFSGTVSSIVTSGGTSFRVVNSVNSRAWSLVPSTNGAESDLWLYYGGTGTGTKVSFVNNGNVLIGSTTDSGQLLQVNGTSKFTGALSGTSATFSANFTIGSDLFLSSGTASIVFNSAANFNTQIYQTGGSLVLYTGANPRLTIASNGAATFSSSIAATSATFSGLVTINSNIRGLAINRDAVTNYNGIGYQTAGVQQWFVGMRENLSSNDYVIYNESGYDNFKLSKSNGAATFSNDIQGGGDLYFNKATRTTIYPTTTNQNLHIKSNGSGVLQFNNDNTGNLTMCVGGGNVLIGTTTDIGQRLQVSGGYITQIDGGVRTFLGYDGSGSLVGTTTNHYLRFITNDTERMRITSAGDTQPGSDNAFSLGVSGARWSAVWAANGTIQTSDEREKKDIIDADLGLDFISKLRPVSFKWKVGQNIVTSEVVKDEEGNPILDEEGNEKTESVIVPREGKRTHYGLIAQEVEELLDGKDFGGFIHDEETDTKGLRYDQFIPLLIKSIQELEAKIVTLESKLN
jgi:hypothetical protein